MKRILLFSIILGLVFSTLKLEATVYKDEKTGEFSCKIGKYDEKKGASYGYFVDGLFEMGFDKIVITTNKMFSDADQAYAAGYLEGCLQSERIDYTVNLGMSNWGTIPDKVIEFWTKNIKWINDNEQETGDLYWTNLKLIFSQIEGMHEAYNFYNSRSLNLTYYEFLVYTVVDSIWFMAWKGDGNNRNMFSVPEDDHCSVMIALLPDNSDLMFSHNLWFAYSTLMLQYKKYHLNFNNKLMSSDVVYVYSMPGIIDSIMHFVLTEAGLAITETSLGTKNATSYLEFINPQTVVTQFRSILAARTSSSATEWLNIFQQHNSGTFNCQWFVLDTNKFTPGQDIPDETVYMVEQMPFYIISEDVSKNLSDTKYLGGYNVAFFDNIKDIAGINAYVKDHPDEAFLYSYSDCPRGKIYRESKGAGCHSKVVDLQTAKDNVRYDDWKNDPLSLGNAFWITAARGDLRNETMPVGELCDGAIDGKLILLNDWKEKREMNFVVSPPFVTNPIFQWSGGPCEKMYHEGLPDVWNFNWTAINGND